MKVSSFDIVGEKIRDKVLRVVLTTPSMLYRPRSFISKESETPRDSALSA